MTDLNIQKNSFLQYFYFQQSEVEPYPERSGGWNPYASNLPFSEFFKQGRYTFSEFFKQGRYPFSEFFKQGRYPFSEFFKQARYTFSSTLISLV